MQLYSLNPPEQIKVASSCKLVCMPLCRALCLQAVADIVIYDLVPLQ